LNAKCETPASADNEWFLFVKLHEEFTRQTYYVEPRDVVAAAVFANHRDWLARPGRNGKPHRDNPMRQLRTKHLDGYREQWDLLRRPTHDAPLLIHEDYHAIVARRGFPPGHPGWPGLS
jgi:hypothetical protein